MQPCVRAESILASYLLAKEARSPKSGIVKNALFFPNHTPNLTLLNPFKANFFCVRTHQSPSLTSTDNISTTTYPIVMKNPPLERSFHCAANRKNSDEKASQIPRVHDITLAKSGIGAFKAETNCSSAVEQLRSSFFLDSIRGGFLHFVESTTSCHGNSRRLNSAPRLR